MYSPCLPPPVAGELTLKLFGLDRVKVRPYVGIPGWKILFEGIIEIVLKCFSLEADVIVLMEERGIR